MVVNACRTTLKSCTTSKREGEFRKLHDQVGGSPQVQNQLQPLKNQRRLEWRATDSHAAQVVNPALDQGR